MKIKAPFSVRPYRRTWRGRTYFNVFANFAGTYHLVWRFKVKNGH